MIFLILFSLGIMFGSFSIFKFLQLRSDLRIQKRKKAWDKQKTLNSKGVISYSF
jgi:hypothetical protein